MGDELTTELRMNLVAVKRVDPYARDIIDTSSHVAFYTFDSEKDEWAKTEVEGAFFIYSRNAEPYFSIFINNRLNTNSLVEPVTGLIEIQKQPPFLLYRNERSRIRGFWFHNNNECERIADLFAKLIKECEIKQTLNNTKDIMDQPKQQLTTINNNNNNNNVDIFSMLSKAQEDFNNSMGTEAATTIATSVKTEINKTSVKQVNNQPDVTSSVKNFFAAAKPTPTEVPMFQRMLSNPVHVELLEKQQRVTTPHENRSASPPQLPAQAQNIIVPAQQVQHHQTNHQTNVGTELGTSPLATFLNTTNLQAVRSSLSNAPLHATDVSDLESRQKPLNQLLRKTDPNLTPSKPALLLPTMFLSPSTNKTLPFEQLRNQNSCQSIVQQQQQQHQQQMSKPEPLTQSQLLQAMTYLIKNDPEFIKKLHEAYLNSFTEMVSL